MTPQLTPGSPDGQTLGEIMVRGNLVMKGHFNNPEAAASAFEGGLVSHRRRGGASRRAH